MSSAISWAIALIALTSALCQLALVRARKEVRDLVKKAIGFVLALVFALSVSSLSFAAPKPGPPKPQPPKCTPASTPGCS